MTYSKLSSALSRWSREHWLLTGTFACLGLLVLTIIPGFDNALREPARQLSQASLALPLPPLARSVAANAKRSAWQILNVESGQTLGAIFQQLGLPATTMHRILDQSKTGQALVRLRAGAELAFDISASGELRGLRFDRDDEHVVELHLDGEKVKETVIPRAVERRVMVASGEITSSLYAAGEKAGLGASVINEMANVFSYDIDFSRDLQDGDRFQVIFEEIWVDGERVRSGGIVGASFINRDKEFTAFRFEREGKSEYFDGSGRPLRKSFMRMPIEFARISSRFSNSRRHPVLGITRAHRGVDYAAGTGTPIMAAGDARVAFAGWKSGYGRCVILDHGRGITTLYGHMSRFGKYKTGQHVGQGNVIGHVGQTGLASGPHLHYEFRVGGVHRDPLTVTMPKPQPLDGSDMARFRAATAPVFARLERIGTTRLASR